MIRFFIYIHHSRYCGLHAISHFVGVKASKDFGVAGFLEAFAIERADGVVKASLTFAGDAFGTAKVENGVAFSPEGNALE